MGATDLYFMMTEFNGNALEPLIETVGQSLSVMGV